MKTLLQSHVLQIRGLSTPAASHIVMEDVAKYTARVSFGPSSVRFMHMVMSHETLKTFEALADVFPALRVKVFEKTVHEKIGKVCAKFVYESNVMPLHAVTYVYRVL